MKNYFKNNIRMNIFLWFMIVFAVGAVWIWHSSSNSPESKKLESNIAEMNEDYSFYKHAIESNTEEQYIKNIDKDNINLSSKINGIKPVIKQSLEQVYNQTKNTSDYENLKSKIKDLGSEWSDILSQISEPKISQSGKEQAVYDSMTDLKIAFGKYDISTKTMSCYVLVNWKSPVIAGTAQGGSQTLKGSDFFTMDYKVTDNSFSNVQYKQTMDGADK
ncbi:hypothetical protein [Lactococcus lactis]|uniref:hypothetical protein n=1 Tax=Lactococcus lactis TaxID=1358 RepID=UPI0019133E88|nr:hypothetical protein [Lactococcus lactis]WDA67454.1 hypothetical protein IL310_01425 [Lactococcus lactis]WDA67475.1 hypothetical protein IL310_01530 [Lactococcus lactis]